MESLRPKSKVSTEFNMSSMTDIIFLLLIFFIITSTLGENPVLKVILPKGVKQNVVNECIKVYVSKDLEYAIGNEKVDYEHFPEKLKQKLNNKSNITVSVHGDKDVKYERIMELIFVAEKMGAKPVLALQPE